VRDLPRGAVRDLPRGAVRDLPRGAVRDLPRGARLVWRAGPSPWCFGTFPVVPCGTFPVVLRDLPRGTVRDLPRGAIEKRSKQRRSIGRAILSLLSTRKIKW
jgi:hypothetical protein